MIDTKLLKQKILDLAIRGKLVPQDPNDEPASVLLERIRAEKERLVAEGKIKRTKSTTDNRHYENSNNPFFEIPNNWVWASLRELCSFLSRGKSPKYADEIRQYPVFAQKCNLFNGDISLEKARFLDPNTLSKWGDEYKLRDGDVLVNSTGTGTVGRTRLFHSDVLGNYPFVVPDSHVSVIRTFDEIESKYVYAYLSSVIIQKHLEDNLAGSTNQRELYIDVLGNLAFPLPPKVEQVRIIAEIEKWFGLISAIEDNKQDIEEFVKQAKNKILSLAISGKLVAQDPSDEPAIDLLRRINPSFLPCDNSHYPNLPIQWTICNLLDITELLDNKRKPIKAEERAKRIEGKSVLYPYYGATGFVGFIDKYLIDGHYILLGEDGAPFLDKFATKAYEVNGKMWVNNHAHVLFPKIDFDYLLYYLNAIDYAPYAKGTTRLKLTQGDMSKMVVLLPPVNEQKRISQKISELFNILEAITEEL